MTDSKPFSLGSVNIGSGSGLFLIAGPCVIESEAHAIKMADAIKAIAGKLQVPYIFKASYDKANRTSLKSFRGPGITEGLRILQKVKKETGVPVLTDVHQATDVPAVAAAIDVVQIPAFLCRQTDLLVAAAKHAKAINIKKGQFVSPWDMRHAVNKVRESGYNNLVVDMRSLAIMRQFAPVVFDATHSVQLPSSGAGGEAVSGGQPEFIPLLSRAAVAAGVDGVFMEVHDNPSQAKSDGANALDSTKLRGVLKELLAVQKAVADSHNSP